MFVGAFDELQHFIWSLAWTEWRKFRCKAPIIFIFGSTIFSCIKWGWVCYKSISPYGNLEMYVDHVFIERLVGWRQRILLCGTYQCLLMTCNSPGHNKLKWSTVLGELCLKLVCLWRVWSPTQDFIYLYQFQSRLWLYYSQSVYEEPTGWEYMWYPPGTFVHRIDINNSATVNRRHHHDLICQISTVYEMY